MASARTTSAVLGTSVLLHLMRDWHPFFFSTDCLPQEVCLARAAAAYVLASPFAERQTDSTAAQLAAEVMQVGHSHHPAHHPEAPTDLPFVQDHHPAVQLFAAAARSSIFR
eukprot:CAMPEP_0204378462 /NCGR_PEP_ID=MMETSP0469-20131031/51803_1 /ASSEMBLY_ACC=CAM_ASM_000384 /TAXON_ID=2969 /ORGANISM="Oxyrrhis marina" /LENGTH=110 /DNA_ID=CAMNT_0051369747 /DNA_START=367 /DNA_END=699 /DNA_ORIENTATION=+